MRRVHELRAEPTVDDQDLVKRREEVIHER